MNTYAQSTITIRVTDSKTKELLVGAIANIEGTVIGSIAGIDGIVILSGIPGGKQAIRTRNIGYSDRYDTLIFPLASPDTFAVALEPSDEELDGVVVSSTRSSRTIQDIPTRIELIGADELNEKANMKPGDIRMVLSESTGIQTLQTSAASGNSDIRIQGMDGRYTQVLKDGFPLYAGFSSGLGLLQTPPLDLKRIEIIKGSSSTLYGGGAIAGLIDLISRTPTKEREISFLVNGTSAKGLDVNGFYGQRYGKIGFTAYAAYDANAAYAPGNTPFTAIPQFSRYTFNPRLFIYPGSNTEITVGVNASFERRLGGDIHYIQGERDSLHPYYEDNNTQRLSSQVELKHRFAAGELDIKNSIDHFSRIINMPAYIFDGTQASTFSEVSYSTQRNKLDWVLGANYFSDAFSEVRHAATPSRNYMLNTAGVFVQNTWDISKQFILETGLRGDYVVQYGLAVLPRLSLLYKVNSSLSTRVGGGLGYKAPTIFTEESERISYRNVLPVSTDSNKLEHSFGGNWDINYKTSFIHGKVRVSFNQLFFYTHLNDPLMLTPVAMNSYRFENVNGHIDALGTETNVKIRYNHFQLFLGYTFTHSHLHEGSTITETPLTPAHHTNTVLMYEIEGNIKIGAEAYYYSRQRLSDGAYGRDYWLCGLMAEKTIKKVALFINFENMLDSRQTRFDNIYIGSITNPQFRDIYAPLDGFVVNGGIKIHL